jgi:predicted alpha/beta-hydrolase family hydrolase
MRHPFMTGVADGLAAGRVSVLRFNFPYIDAGRRVPDPPAVLLDTWHAIVREAARRAGGLPLVVGGKSMGGRIASMLAADQGLAFPAKVLVFFGYPLHPPGRPDRLRDAHLPRVRVPMIFIQGSRDALARIDVIEAIVQRLHPLAQLHVVEGGDHSFRRRGAKRSDHENGRGMAQIAIEHIRGIITQTPASG